MRNGAPVRSGRLYRLVVRSSHEDLPQLRPGPPMHNLPWVMLRPRSSLLALAAQRATSPTASERFRFVPRTFRPLFGRLIVRRSMRAVCPLRRSAMNEQVVAERRHSASDIVGVVLYADAGFAEGRNVAI